MYILESYQYDSVRGMRNSATRVGVHLLVRICSGGAHALWPIADLGLYFLSHA